MSKTKIIESISKIPHDRKRYVLDEIRKTKKFQLISKYGDDFYNLLESLLTEATAEEIRLKYYSDISEEDFNKIVSADKISSNLGKNKLGMYGKWLLNLYKNGNLRLEDLYKAEEYLPIFDKLSKQNRLENKDINTYKSLADLYSCVIQPVRGENLMSKKEANTSIKVDPGSLQNGVDYEITYSDSEWEVIIPKTMNAAIWFGKGTEWCTADPKPKNNAFDGYMEQYKEPIYIIINKENGRKLQFHRKSKQFMDEKDDMVDPENDFVRTIPENVWKTIGFDDFSLYNLWDNGYYKMSYPFEEKLGIQVFGLFDSYVVFYKKGEDLFRLDRNVKPTHHYNENYIMLQRGPFRFRDRSEYFYDRYNVESGCIEEIGNLLNVKHVKNRYETKFYYWVGYGIYDLDRNEEYPWPTEVADDVDVVETVLYNGKYFFVFIDKSEEMEETPKHIKVVKIPVGTSNCEGVEYTNRLAMSGIFGDKSWFFESNQNINIDDIVNKILFEDNKKLKGRNFQVPPELYKELVNKLDKIKGNKKFTTRKNYKRLENIVNRKGKISYKWMYTFVDWRDKFNGVLGGEEQDVEAWLISADKFMDWVDKELKQATESINMSDNATSNIAFTSTYWK